MDKSKTYGYTIISSEHPKVAKTLWAEVKRWILTAPKEWFPEDNWIDFVSDDRGKSWNMKMYVLRLFKSYALKAYLHRLITHQLLQQF